MNSDKHSLPDIKIIDFTVENKDAIKSLNEEWLKKYFRIEPGDVISLSDPVGEIINKGGLIYYAVYNERIVGTASLLKVEDSVYELAKMAVTESAQGLGIGKALLDHCLAVSAAKSVKRLILYSSTKLGSAIHLYRKYGFVEIPLEPGHYERADIKMEKKF